MNRDVDSEVLAQEVNQVLPRNVGVERLGSACENQERPEEVDEHGVHDGVVAQRGLDWLAGLPQQAEELADESFELGVIKCWGVVVIVEHDVKSRVIDHLLHLLDEGHVVRRLYLEAQF